MGRLAEAAGRRAALSPAASHRPAVLDFYCASCRLAIEVDGGVHDLQPERDIERTRVLETHGIRVIRFRNAEVLTDLPRVVASITQAIVQHHAELASSQPPPGVLGEVRA